MNREQKLFLQILADHLEGRVTIPVEDINWHDLTSISRKHQLNGIVFFQCKTFMPVDVKSHFEKYYGGSLFCYINWEKEYRDIQEKYNKIGLPYYIIKGIPVAKCYPIPALRTMGDMDIIVQREDKEIAGQALEALGFQIANKNPEYEWQFIHNDMHFELHHQLIYNEAVTLKKQADFFNNSWRYVVDGKLDWSFHFLFLIAHLRKHILNSGAGFRMFLDIAAVIQRNPGLDWLWINNKLDELDMGKFSRVCFALIDDWFGVKSPIDYPDLNERFLEQATEKTFANGIFGFDKESNKQNAVINSILSKAKSRKISRIKMVLSYMFPQYINMRYISCYQFVDGKPWLLPLAWIFRFLRLVSGKTRGILVFWQKVKIPDEIVDDREKELRLWGLME